MQKDAKELMNKKKYYMLSQFGAVPWGRGKKKKSDRGEMPAPEEEDALLPCGA